MGSSILGGPFGSPGAPGFVPPAASAAIGPAAAQSAAAMANRYSQLGFGGPGVTGGGPPTSSMGTPEAMDLGVLPSTGGGIAGQFGAIPGQLQNLVGSANLGKGTSPATLLGNIGSFFGGTGTHS